MDDQACYHFRRKRCQRLIVDKCDPNTCKFYESKEEAAASKEKANARLRRLPDLIQNKIAGKYYGGTKPWLE